MAATYNGTITYGELARRVEDESGIRTRQRVQHWTGKVLGLVSDDCAERGEPLLSALCMRRDHTVGEGYAAAVEQGRGERPLDPEVHAANERFECYRRWGAVLPADGGRPVLPPREQARRERQRFRTASPSPAVCEECRLALPTSGVCGSCS